MIYCISKRTERLSGNILFLILIAVALFAALSYAVTQSSKSGGSGISKDKAKILASQMIQYATGIEQAITRLKLVNKCTNEQITFEDSTTSAGYVNANAPADKRCHVFDPAGGGLAFTSNWFPGEPVPYNLFLARTEFLDVGTTGNGTASTDLYWLYELPAAAGVDFCNAYNKALKIDVATPPTESIWGSPTFNGTYLAPSPTVTAALRGLHSACYHYTSGRYLIYYVLIAR